MDSPILSIKGHKSTTTGMVNFMWPQSVLISIISDVSVGCFWRKSAFASVGSAEQIALPNVSRHHAVH